MYDEKSSLADKLQSVFFTGRPPLRSISLELWKRLTNESKTDSTVWHKWLDFSAKNMLNFHQKPKHRMYMYHLFGSTPEQLMHLMKQWEKAVSIYIYILWVQVLEIWPKQIDCPLQLKGKISVSPNVSKLIIDSLRCLYLWHQFLKVIGVFVNSILRIEILIVSLSFGSDRHQNKELSNVVISLSPWNIFVNGVH